MGETRNVPSILTVNFCTLQPYVPGDKSSGDRAGFELDVLDSSGLCGGGQEEMEVREREMGAVH